MARAPRQPVQRDRARRRRARRARLGRLRRAGDVRGRCRRPDPPQARRPTDARGLAGRDRAVAAVRAMKRFLVASLLGMTLGAAFAQGAPPEAEARYRALIAE